MKDLQDLGVLARPLPLQRRHRLGQRHLHLDRLPSPPRSLSSARVQEHVASVVRAVERDPLLDERIC